MGPLSFLSNLYSDIQSLMSSVERMQAYSRIPNEKAAILPSDNLLPRDWPIKGAIRF